MSLLSGKHHFTLLALLLIGTITASIFSSCKKEEEEVFPPTPQIYLQYVTPSHIKFTDPDGEVKIVLDFTDGDGNIGRDPNIADTAITIIDSRDSSRTFKLGIPIIPDALRQENSGVKGVINLFLESTFFPLRNDSIHNERDTMHWIIYLKDEGGNISNEVVTPDFYIER